MIFAVSPQHNGSSRVMNLTMDALFGFFAYATYDLTNLATLRDWPLRLSLIDIGWGTVVSAASAAHGGKAARWTGPLERRLERAGQRQGQCCWVQRQATTRCPASAPGRWRSSSC